MWRVWLHSVRSVWSGSPWTAKRPRRSGTTRAEPRKKPTLTGSSACWVREAGDRLPRCTPGIVRLCVPPRQSRGHRIPPLDPRPAPVEAGTWDRISQSASRSPVGPRIPHTDRMMTLRTPRGHPPGPSSEPRDDRMVKHLELISPGPDRGSGTSSSRAPALSSGKDRRLSHPRVRPCLSEVAGLSRFTINGSRNVRAVALPPGDNVGGEKWPRGPIPEVCGHDGGVAR